MNITLCGIIQTILLTLKIAGVLTWSWWAVLIPTWITIVLNILAAQIIIEDEDDEW